MPFPFLAAAAVAILGGGATASALTQKRAEKHESTVRGETLDAHEIYKRIRGGRGPDKLRAAEDAAAELRDRYQLRQDQIHALNKRMRNAWHGAAADAAQAHMLPLIESFLRSAALLHSGRGGLSSQVQSFSDVYSRVEQVPRTPPTSGLLNDINPITTDTDRAIADYNAKASNNVAAYNAYGDASSANGTRLSRDYPLVGMMGVPPVTVRPAGGGAPPPVPPVPRPSGPGTDDRSAIGGRIDTRSRAGDPSVRTPPVPGPDDTTTRQQGWTPPPPTARPPVGPAGTPAPVSTTPGPPVSGFGGVAGTGRPVPSAPGGRGTGGGQRGAGPNAGASGAGRAVSGAPRGASGVPGAGALPVGGGAGRSRGDEDPEHRNKYLAKPNPHSIFGGDEPVPPAVIGGE